MVLIFFAVDIPPTSIGIQQNIKGLQHINSYMENTEMKIFVNILLYLLTRLGRCCEAR
jgi:hypothetical protein